MGRKKAWLWTLLSPAVLGLAVGAQVAMGQDKPTGYVEKPVRKKKTEKPQGKRPDRPVKARSEFGEYAAWVKDLGLSVQQQAILKEVVKTAQEAREALYKAHMEIARNQREEALAVLTPAQKGVLAGLRLYEAVLGRYRGTGLVPGKSKGGQAELPPSPMQLTEAQKEEIKAICVEAAKHAPGPGEGPAPDGKAKRRAGPPDKLMQAIRNQVLTVEQKSALAASQLQRWVMGRGLAGLGKGNDALRISQEQLAEIRAICHSAANNLDPNADEKANSDAFQKVMEEVRGLLTPQQREELDKRMKPRPGGKK